MKEGHGEARSDQSDQRPRNPSTDPRRAHGHDQHAGAERERVGIGAPELAENMDESYQHMPPLLGDPEKGRQLAYDDVNRDAGEEASGHWDREQRGEPASPEQTDGD